MHKQSKVMMTTKTMAYCAMLTAMSVVLARLAGFMPGETSRFSIEAVPIFLSGMLFGAVAGGLVGFSADFIGCILFSSYGYNPIFCVPPVLYGVCAGILRWYLCAPPKKLRFSLRRIPFLRQRSISLRSDLLRLIVGWLIPVVLGSILYQSCTLAMIYGGAVFYESLLIYLSSRSIQFAIMLVIYVVITFFLCKSNIFKRMGVWPVRKEQ